VTSEDTRHSVSVAGVVIDKDGRALVIQRRDNAHWEPPGGIIALVFRCRPTGGALTENSEVSGFRWIRESDVRSIMSEAYAVRILDAYQHNAVPSIRNHDGVRLLVPAAN
jgi:hypothetical protein